AEAHGRARAPREPGARARLGWALRALLNVIREVSSETARDRAGRALESDAVDGLHRDEVFRRARDESLVGRAELLRRILALLDLDPVAARALEDEARRDPREDPALERGRVDGPASHEEEVARRALGEVAVLVQHGCLERSGTTGFHERDHVVQVVAALDARV